MKRVSRIMLGMQVMMFVTGWFSDADADGKIDGEEVGGLLTGLGNMIGPMFGYRISVNIEDLE